MSLGDNQLWTNLLLLLNVINMLFLFQKTTLVNAKYKLQMIIASMIPTISIVKTFLSPNHSKFYLRLDTSLIFINFYFMLSSLTLVSNDLLWRLIFFGFIPEFLPLFNIPDIFLLISRSLSYFYLLYELNIGEWSKVNNSENISISLSSFNIMILTKIIINILEFYSGEELFFLIDQLCNNVISLLTYSVTVIN